MLKIESGLCVLLDFLRGFSAQLVLIGHALSFYSPTYADSHILVQDYAIIFFFFISGFLITNSILIQLSKSTYSFRKFLFLRFTRIYSVLIPALFFVLTVDFYLINYSSNYLFTATYNINSFISSLFLITSYDSIIYILTGFKDILSPLGSFRPIWTLSIEWFIYLFVGLMFSIIYVEEKSKSLYLFKITMLLIFSLVPLLHFISTKLSFVWFFGACSIFLLQHKCVISLYSNKFLLSVFIIFTVLLILLNSFLFGIFTYITIVSSSIFLSLLFFRYRFYFFSKCFSKSSKYLAFYSFSLYVTHYTVLELLRSLSIEGVFNNLVIAFFVCNVFAVCFAYVFEYKLYNKLRGRLIIV